MFLKMKGAVAQYETNPLEYLNLASRFLCDTVVVSFGSHPFSGKHWTFGFYQKYLNTFIRSMGRAPLIWMTPPAIPIRTDVYVQQPKDWRNNFRLRMVTEWTVSYLRRARPNMPVINQFAMTYPALECTNDNAHFTGYAQDAIVDMLMELLCLYPTIKR